MRYNARNDKRCALCRHWYSPSYSVSGRDIYEIDINIKSKCLVHGINTRSDSSCKYYEASS